MIPWCRMSTAIDPGIFVVIGYYSYLILGQHTSKRGGESDTRLLEAVGSNLLEIFSSEAQENACRSFGGMLQSLRNTTSAV